jgi:hypothetical protein
MDYGQMMRVGAGGMGGIGQSMMTKSGKAAYGAGRSGGYRDLAENQQIGLYQRTGRFSANDPKMDFKKSRQELDNFKALYPDLAQNFAGEV